jgi:hypothetical protein
MTRDRIASLKGIGALPARVYETKYDNSFNDLSESDIARAKLKRNIKDLDYEWPDGDDQ